MTNSEKDNDNIAKLERRTEMAEASLRALTELVRALVATHPNPDVLLQAFTDFSEKTTAIALGTSASDSSLAAYAMFRANWEEWLRWASRGTGPIPPSDRQ